jgi:hypothetical protein
MSSANGSGHDSKRRGRSPGQEGGGRKKKKTGEREFTIDEEFFHSVIMPSIYSTIVAGVRQENIAMFNLLFSLEIALKKLTVTKEDKDYFLSKFLALPNCYNWRTMNEEFVEPQQRVEKKKYLDIKRELLKLYPSMRKFFETIEIKIGNEFSYKEISTLLYKKLFMNEFKDTSLIK